MQVLAQKLKRLRRTLKSWNAQYFGNIFQRLQEVEDDVLHAEAVYDQSLHLENRVSYHQAIAQHKFLLCCEESFWRAKARVKHMAEGDGNAKYFHNIYLSRRQKLLITSINSEREWGSAHFTTRNWKPCSQLLFVFIVIIFSCS
jgi:hypothetical protein